MGDLFQGITSGPPAERQRYGSGCIRPPPPTTFPKELPLINPEMRRNRFRNGREARPRAEPFRLRNLRICSLGLLESREALVKIFPAHDRAEAPFGVKRTHFFIHALLDKGPVPGACAAFSE